MNTKQCPFCGEEIKAAAIKCRFCGEMQNEEELMECPYCSEEIISTCLLCPHCNSDLARQLTLSKGSFYFEKYIKIILWFVAVAVIRYGISYPKLNSFVILEILDIFLTGILAWAFFTLQGYVKNFTEKVLPFKVVAWSNIAYLPLGILILKDSLEERFGITNSEEIDTSFSYFLYFLLLAWFIIYLVYTFKGINILDHIKNDANTEKLRKYWLVLTIISIVLIFVLILFDDDSLTDFLGYLGGIISSSLLILQINSVIKKAIEKQKNEN